MSESKYEDSQGKIICQECGKSFGSITPQHTKKSHSMTIQEYKEKYPDSPLLSQSMINKSVVSNKARLSDSQIFKNSEVKKPEIKNQEEIIVDEVLSDSDVLSDIDIEEIQESLIEVKKKEIEELETLKKDLSNKQEIEFYDDDFDPYNTTSKQKLELLRNLRLLYPNIKNNYSIEKCSPSGRLEYKFITDIADPVKKVIFEFPNTFWRNIDNPPNHLKADILKRDGWRIITVKENAPNMETMRKYFDFIID